MIKSISSLFSKDKRENVLYYFLVFSLFLLSFFLYSSLFYPLLNSDNAVTILMISDFDLPQDFYFWGQDRMGSIIPLIAQLFNKPLGLSEILSESIVHYAILLLGFFAFASFLRSKWYKIIFAVVWFFPPMHLIDVTQFAFGIHYSLIGIACYLLNILGKEDLRNKIVIRHFYLLSVTILLIGSVWVSDMAMISVGIVLGVHAILFLKKNRNLQRIITNSGFYYLLVGIFLGKLFINYAKQNASAHREYAGFGNFDTIWKTFDIFLDSIKDLMTFEYNEPFTTIYTYLVILILCFAIWSLYRVNLRNESKKWLAIFTLDAIVLFLIIITSIWTLENNVPRRYFTCTYISLAMSILLFFDSATFKVNVSKGIKIFVLITVMIGGFGTIYTLKYISPKRLTPTAQIVGEFKHLGRIGIIGDYWNSYLTACVNPEKVKATPHEFSYAVRNQALVEEVFKQEKIYIIKDMWFDEFPDTLNQFGRILIKQGKEFKIGGCTVHRYKVIP